jgi:hypothetical protein
MCNGSVSNRSKLTGLLWTVCCSVGYPGCFPARSGRFLLHNHLNKDGIEQPIGFVFQRIRCEQSNGVDTLAIVVHQHLLSGKLDMRDSFLLRREDLKPIRLDTDRDGAPHVHLDHTNNHVTGWKVVNGSRRPVDIAFDGQYRCAPVCAALLWSYSTAQT